ncbi:MAG: SUMF1/EgtB/PvdO family nonheme iron enzyme [Alphaproteobacteria bacterium]|nr:SUMF1/EgtB/PvdO family nonheme iron enzyme [Alphaproteobacteria bacterium]
MGIVLEVEDPELQLKRAAKILSKKSFGGCRALVEGRAMAALDDHVNVLRVHELVSLDNNYALIMDLVRGGTFAERMSDARDPCGSELFQHFQAVLSAVAEGHRLGIVHGDIKPQNILMQQTNGPYVPLVADFGLSAISGDTVHRDFYAGTPRYSAPEQYQVPVPYNKRTDVFALGVILLELLEGGCSTVLHEADTGRTVVPLERRRGYMAVAKKATAATPDERYSCAGEMLTEFVKATRIENGTFPLPDIQGRGLHLLVGIVLLATWLLVVVREAGRGYSQVEGDDSGAHITRTLAENSPGPTDKSLAPPETPVVMTVMEDDAEMSFVSFPCAMAEERMIGDEGDQQRNHHQSLLVSTTEVTNAQWIEVMGADGGSASNGSDAKPATGMNFCEAVEFANMMSRRNSRDEAYFMQDAGFCNTPVLWDTSADGFRLPTIGEWQCIVSFDNRLLEREDLRRFAWFDSDDQSVGQTPIDVARFEPVAGGVYDLIGNVEEWGWPDTQIGDVVGRKYFNADNAISLGGDVNSEVHQLFRSASRNRASGWYTRGLRLVATHME